MCGIIGIVSRKNLSGYFDKALNSIRHRGPDAQNSLYLKIKNRNIGFGHTRLRIIDLNKSSDQPMISNDGNYIIIYNGEIYNYKELKEDLINKNYIFKTNSDTEVLLNGYIEYKEDIVNKLDGIFAFAILNKNDGSIFLVRDHLGVKPLYYYFDKKEDYFVFSSEIKAILQFPNIKTNLNSKLLGEYLANMWVQEPDTLFENIYKLSSASFLTYRNGEISIKEYWKPYMHNQNVNELESILRKSIKSQLISDVPLGIFLSGGIDSSIVGHYTLENIDKIKSVTSYYAEKDRKYECYSDDKKYTEQFINYYPNKIKPYYLQLPSEYLDIYEKLIWYLDEPVSDPAIMPAFLLSKNAKERGLTVMLSGMGGDELFGGYPRYNAILKSKYLFPLRNEFISYLIYNTLSFIEHISSDGAMRKRMRDGKRFLDYIVKGFPKGYLSMMGHFRVNDINKLLNGNKWHLDYVDKIINTLGDFRGSLLDEIMLYELKGFLASHNLIYMDKMSMANSLEVRVPLLSKSMVEFSYNLPDSDKIYKGEGKYILKKLAEKYFPRNYVYRKKAGFGSPIRIWLKNSDFRSKIYDSFNSKKITDILDKDKLNNILNDHYKNNIDHSYQIWTIYTLYLWRKTFNI